MEKEPSLKGDTGPMGPRGERGPRGSSIVRASRIALFVLLLVFLEIQILFAYHLIRFSSTQTVTTTVKSTIGSGVYIVGDDIKPGRYEFECTYSIDGSPWGCIISNFRGEYSLDQVNELDDSTIIFKTKYLVVGSLTAFDLEDGTTFVVQYGSGILTQPKNSWAP